MIATMHDAAREQYEAELGLPARGSRVWITGFTRQDHDAAARLLDRHGLHATAFAAVPTASSHPIRRRRRWCRQPSAVAGG